LCCHPDRVRRGGRAEGPAFSGQRTTSLSAKNRELLETIRRTSPQSLAELAERTGRKKPNLSRTLKTMEHYGLVQLRRHKRKLVPRVRFQRVSVIIELTADGRPRLTTLQNGREQEPSA